MRRVAAGEIQAELLEEGPERLELFRRRPLVHAVQRRVFSALQKSGSADVGRQHAFLDQAVRVVALRLHDVLDLALLIEQHLRFGGLEIDGAALLPRLGQDVIQRIQVLQMRQQMRRHRLALYRLQAERGGHAVVGEARLRAHHRGIEAIGPDLALRIHAHLAHHAQAIHLRIERAQAVGELLRQHRDDAARKIHRIAALARGGVQHIAGAHIVAHIGDRHPQAEILALAFAVHGIVEIPRRLAVDGHQRQRAQVLPPLDVVRTHSVGQLFREARHRAREFIRQLVLAQRNLNFHAGVGVVAEHFDDAPCGLRVLVRLGHDFHRHHLAGRSPHVRAGGNQNVLADAPVLGGDEGNAVRFVQAPDQARIGARDDFHDGAFRAPAPVDAARARHDAVAMQHLAHLLLGEEHVGPAVVWHEKAVTVRMPFDATRNQIELTRHQDRVLAVAHDLTFALHRAQAPAEAVHLGGLEMQQMAQVFLLHRNAFPGQRLEYQFAARQWIVIALGFARIVRIARPARRRIGFGTRGACRGCIRRARSARFRRLRGESVRSASGARVRIARDARNGVTSGRFLR